MPSTVREPDGTGPGAARPTSATRRAAQSSGETRSALVTRTAQRPALTARGYGMYQPPSDVLRLIYTGFGAGLRIAVMQDNYGVTNTDERKPAKDRS